MAEDGARVAGVGHDELRLRHHHHVRRAPFGVGVCERTAMTNLLGHLWSDKWTALSGPLLVWGLGIDGCGV